MGVEVGDASNAPGSVTGLLLEWRAGDARALEELVTRLYDELRRLARLQMRDQPAGHTLQPTALVHEAYVRMVDLQLAWRDRTHFLSMAARTMRRVLVDHARARRTAKRGAGRIEVTLRDFHASEHPSFDLLAIDEALETLSREDERASRVLELRYFGGLTGREIAGALEVSSATVERDLRFGRSWLRRELSSGKRDG